MQVYVNASVKIALFSYHTIDYHLVQLVTLIFQAVQSEFRVGSFAVIQQLQLQVDVTDDWMRYKAAEPWLVATILWSIEVKSGLDSSSCCCKDVTDWMFQEWFCVNVGVVFDHLLISSN